MAGLVLRGEHASSIERSRPAKAEVLIEDALDRLLEPDRLDQRGGDDRAGVDHRVERYARARLQGDRVERLAAGLDVDVLTHSLFPDRLQGEGESERLGDRLDRELLAGVADFIDGATGGHDTDAEQVRVGRAELGDVRSDFTGRVAGFAVVKSLEQ